MVPFLIGLAETADAIGLLFLLGALKWIESSDPGPAATTVILFFYLGTEIGAR